MFVNQSFDYINKCRSKWYETLSLPNIICYNFSTIIRIWLFSYFIPHTTSHAKDFCLLYIYYFHNTRSIPMQSVITSSSQYRNMCQLLNCLKYHDYFFCHLSTILNLLLVKFHITHFCSNFVPGFADTIDFVILFEEKRY